MQLTDAIVAGFREVVWRHYREAGRSMPWRDDPSPYHVLVSEVMLQQTQVSRAIVKFEEFMVAFPDIEALAKAPLAEVLKVWSGLGYNRRAKYLHQAARQIVDDDKGMPTTLSGLIRLPGIGSNTAGAILNYAYNTPTAFVETNIRTVYFHHFFSDSQQDVDDRLLLGLVEGTMDRKHPREWFWALMDYGTYLKRTAGSRLNQSRHYKKQAPLKGSLREMRGRIIKQLSVGSQTYATLVSLYGQSVRLKEALAALEREGMIERRDDVWCLTGDRNAS